MTVLECLPTELVLRVLAYLPFPSLRNLRLTSRSWGEFFTENESSIYHHAARLHNFIDSVNTLLPEAKATHPLPFLQGVPDWYEYCRMYFQLQRNWLGATPATTKFYGGHPYDIHRLKVDEEHGILITTHEFGGLTVFDLETTEVLWKLDSTYVRHYAHCEYENGFLIFDQIGAAKEIWRLEALYNPAEVPASNHLTDTQMEAWIAASNEYAASRPHGHFRPWALVETAEFGRAYRFVYPMLLVCGLTTAYVWDVRTASLVQEVENVQGNAGGGDINYVELSQLHVFVCSTSALRVFSRQNGALVLEIPSYQLMYSDIRLAVQLGPAVARHKLAGPGEAVALPAAPTMSTALYTASYAEFSAVHVSRDGKDLITQLSDSRLVVIRDFARIIRGEVSLKVAALEIGKTIPRLSGADEHFSLYLAAEFGRLAVVTTSGVYAATLDPTYHGVMDEDLLRTGRRRAFGIPQSAIDAGVSFPYLTFVSLPYYHNRRQLTKVTCIQITETKLFFVWDAMYKPDNVDFFRQLGMIDGNTPPPRSDADDFGAGFFTPAATVAHASTQVGHGWDPQDVTESQVMLASGSGTHAVPEDTAEAGPSNAVVDSFSDDEEEDEDEDEEGEYAEDSDDDDWHPGQPIHDGQNPVNGIAHDHHFASTGPIVFCIDFTPK